jgi:hypothetical protein
VRAVGAARLDADAAQGDGADGGVARVGVLRSW